MLDLQNDGVEALCRRYGIRRLALLGSALRDDFGEGSDIDLLADLAPTARLSLRQLVAAEQGFSDLLGRSVDLIIREDLERSPRRRRRDEILRTARPFYVA